MRSIIPPYVTIFFCLAALGGAQAEIKVKDGDSVVVDGKEVRLRNHNAPEIGKKGGPGGAKCHEERRLGLLAKRRVQQLVREGEKKGTLELKMAGVKDSTHAKRELGVLSIDGKDVGKTLQEEGLAKRSGGPGHREFCR